MKAEDLLGRMLAGKYSLESLLGKGGFGAVYRATHHPIGRTVAVKVSLQPHRDDLHTRFVREAQVLGQLRHPSCAMLLDFGEEADGLFYMVQEFVDGQTLTERLRDQGPFAPSRAVAIVREVLGALHEAHRIGIVHRDIKPANVMLTRGLDDEEEVRVLDFGIAKVLHGDAIDATLTNTGAVIGSPAFMAPEQIRQGVVQPATDLYAVGAMLYRLLAGTGPFDAPATFDIMCMHLDAPVPLLPYPAPGLDAVIGRAMAKAPGDRYRSAREMIAALDAHDAPRPSVVPMPMPVEPPPDGETTNARGERVIEDAPPREGRSLWLVVAGLIVLGGLIGLGARWWADDRSTDAETRADAPAVAVVGAGSAPATATLVFEAGVADAAPPDAAPPDAAPPDAAPPARSTTSRRKPRTPRGGRRVVAQTPSPTRSAPARPAAAPPAEPPRPSPSADVLAAAFGDHLAACRCRDASRALDALRAVEVGRAASLRVDYEDECKARLPGNCLDKERQ